MAKQKTQVLKAGHAGQENKVRMETGLLDTEVASRLKDPFDKPFMGVIAPNDPLLRERGGMGSRAHDIYRDLLRDGKVFACLQKRKLAVVGREWQVEPIVDSTKGQQDAQTVRQILQGFAFDKLCGHLLDAILIGWQPAEIIWTVKDGLVVPQRCASRQQRRFSFVQDDGDTQAHLHLLTEQDMQRGERVPERKFIIHRVSEDDDNPYGSGLGLQLYWPVFFKRKGVLAWNVLCERFGSPIPWGKFPRGATEREKNTLFDGLRAMQTDGLIMTPEGAAIDLIETKLSGGGMSTHQGLCIYMDDWVAEVTLGQPPRTGGGGALAAAATEREDVRLELSQADSDLLCETLNDSLIKWICELNGLELCRVWRRIEKERNTKLEAETDVAIASLGFKPSLEYVRSKYGDEWRDAPVEGVQKTALKPPAFAETPTESDLVDELIAAELESWQPMMAPTMAAIEAIFADAAKNEMSAEQLLQRLSAELGNIPVDEITQALTRSSFAARLAEAVGYAQPKV